MGAGMARRSWARRESVGVVPVLGWYIIRSRVIYN